VIQALWWPEPRLVTKAGAATPNGGAHLLSEFSVTAGAFAPGQVSTSRAWPTSPTAKQRSHFP
jgi:hypothetical protein